MWIVEHLYRCLTVARFDPERFNRIKDDEKRLENINAQKELEIGISFFVLWQQIKSLRIFLGFPRGKSYIVLSFDRSYY